MGSMTLLGAGKAQAGTPAYTGPGDINGAALGWWGLRGFSTAYSTGSSPAVDLVDQTGANSVTINIKSDGTLDLAAIATWVAAHSVTTICVAKLYDQSGSGKHFVQATLAAMPTLPTGSVTGLGSTRPAMSFGGGQNMSASSITQAQPFTESFVGERTAGTGYGYALGDGAAVLLFNNAANGMAMFAGDSVPSASANDNSFHAAQALFKDPGGGLYIDGSSNSMPSMGTSGLSATLFLYTQNGGGGFVLGNFCEVGVWSGDKSANNSVVNSNQHTYWGF